MISWSRRFARRLKRVLPEQVTRALANTALAKFALAESEEERVCRWFEDTFGRPLDLSNPVTFNEKVNWRKLRDPNPLFTQLVDKLAVREYVAGRIGTGYLPRHYQSERRPEDIRFDLLPSQFVLKANHGSGMNLIVRDKSTLDVRAAIEIARQWLQIDYSAYISEWAYKDVPRRVFAEEFLLTDAGETPEDYKFLCIHGEVVLVQLDLDRFTSHRQQLYSPELEPLAVDYVSPRPNQPPVLGDRVRDMADVARTLSRGLDMVRVDLYDVGRIIFGEMTVYPNGGLRRFRPPALDLELGKLWALPENRGGQ